MDNSACPFCASVVLKLAVRSETEVGIYCDACGAIGPLAPNKTIALERWRKRTTYTPDKEWDIKT